MGCVRWCPPNLALEVITDQSGVYFVSRKPLLRPHLIIRSDVWWGSSVPEGRVMLWLEELYLGYEIFGSFCLFRCLQGQKVDKTEDLVLIDTKCLIDITVFESGCSGLVLTNRTSSWENTLLELGTNFTTFFQCLTLWKPVEDILDGFWMMSRLCHDTALNNHDFFQW